MEHLGVKFSRFTVSFLVNRHLCHATDIRMGENHTETDS